MTTKNRLRTNDLIIPYQCYRRRLVFSLIPTKLNVNKARKLGCATPTTNRTDLNRINRELVPS